MEAGQTNVYDAPAHSCIAYACRHYAIDSNTCNPLTCEEARGVEAPFKSCRVHSTHKGEKIGVKSVSREEVTLRSICASYSGPLVALWQRFRSCTGTSVLSVCTGSYSVVHRPREGPQLAFREGLGLGEAE